MERAAAPDHRHPPPKGDPVVGRASHPILAASLAAGLVAASFLPPRALAAAAPQSGATGPHSVPEADRSSPDLWGRVVLGDGDTIDGFLRWDRNETTLADLLDGDRMPTDEGLRLRRALAERTAEDRMRSVELPGLRVTWEEEEPFETRVRSGVRFGRIDRILPDGRGAIVELRGGGSVELAGSSTDLGPAFRGLEVEVAGGEVREVGWAEIAEVRLLPVPDGRRPARARLHGTVETEGGGTFTGWLAWDAEEVFGSDELDGEEGAVEFSDIESIERTRRGVVVTLRTGERRTLTGTNDVDERNRGIHVGDPGLGNAVVGWEAFVSLRLHPAASEAVPMDGGGPLVGTVETESGERIAGRIVWDLDETEGWHLLNGEAEGVQLDIEFSRIRRIDKARGGVGAVVTLRDGRVLELDGSNDVDETNRGIAVVTDDEADRLVDWAGFRSLTLGGG